MAVRAEAMLRAGITTARDLGGGAWLELELRDRINAGELPGPRLLCAGQPITSVAGHCHFWGGEATTVAEAEAVIARQEAHGVDLIKLMATGGMQTPNSQPKDAQFDRSTTAAIVHAANARGFEVAAHCHGTPGIANAAHAGVRTIEHCSWIGESGHREPFDADAAAAIARRGIWVSPTVNAGWARFPDAFAKRVTENFRGMKQAGCRLIASTDAGIPNVRHADLALALPVFAQLAELLPVEALKAATSDCAAALGLGDVTGALREGLAADVLFVDGDPLQDLAALRAPVRVMARGIAVDMRKARA
jgi:imidazolonepropionase-like amidohydrolase